MTNKSPHHGQEAFSLSLPFPRGIVCVAHMFVLPRRMNHAYGVHVWVWVGRIRGDVEDALHTPASVLPEGSLLSVGRYKQRFRSHSPFGI